MTTTVPPAPEWRYTSTIWDGPVVLYNFFYPCEVKASRNGVRVVGPAPVMGSERLAQFIGVLKKAEEACKAIGNGDHAAAKAWVEKANEEVEL